MLIFLRPEPHNPDPPDIHALTAYQPIRPILLPTDKSLPDPIQWLKQNSNNRYGVSKSLLPHVPRLGESSRPRAAIISLVRNSELEGMMQSMRQLEFRWNGKYQVRSQLSRCFDGSDIK
jgi:alpha 1,2-mannosyltransferase